MSKSIFKQSPQESKLNFETRTPTAWGEARTFIEYDFATTPAGARLFRGLRQHQPAPALCLRHLGRLPRRPGQFEFLRFRRRHGNHIVRRPGRRSGPRAHAAVALHDAARAAGACPAPCRSSAEQPETEFWSPGFGVAGSDNVAGVPLKNAAPDLTRRGTSRSPGAIWTSVRSFGRRCRSRTGCSSTGPSPATAVISAVT